MENFIFCAVSMIDVWQGSKLVSDENTVIFSNQNYLQTVFLENLNKKEDMSDEFECLVSLTIIWVGFLEVM